MLQIPSEQLDRIRLAVSVLAKDFLSLTEEIGRRELTETCEDVISHIQDPFLFVIVGEVKSGKSSFINALLQANKEICKVAPSPMTDTIQQILYGEEENEVIVNSYLKRIYQPVEILKEIAIVDTPGTNTIIAHHQEITERFIPNADLIVFVFEAKNPYRESAWKFFDFINEEWWKKVIFVLQQKDLLDEKDLSINRKGVEDHARSKGIDDPKVFCVSAKKAIDGDYHNSGFEELSSYIEAHILGGQAPALKQQNNIKTLQNIHHRIDDGLQLRVAQLDADRHFRKDIIQTLADQEIKSSKQVDILIENLIAEYNEVTLPRTEELRRGLGFISMVSRSIRSAFGMKEGPKEWLEALLKTIETDLNIKLRNKLNDGVIDIADSIQQMGKMVDLKIRNSTTILRNDHEIFSDIAEKRANVLKELQQTFSSFLNNTDNFYDKSISGSSSSISPNLAAASGITAVGIILAAITNGMVFDITGGVLTTAGLLFAGISLGFKRRKILKEFSAEIDRGRELFRSEVSSHLKSYISTIKERIDANFNKFDAHLEKEGEEIERFTDRMTSLNGRISAISSELGADRKSA
jgi:ribosome biogenesis GTPase A